MTPEEQRRPPVCENVLVAQTKEASWDSTRDVTEANGCSLQERNTQKKLMMIQPLFRIINLLFEARRQDGSN